MADESKGDRLWLALCTATGVAVDVTLNKYSSILPGLAVVAIWAIPAVLFAVWFMQVEKTRAWVKTRFMEHPVSYVLMFLILIPFGWQATATMLSKLHAKPTQITTLSSLPPSLASPKPSAPPAAATPPDIEVPSPSRSQKQMAADQNEARRLVLEYRAAHSGEVNKTAELQWINKQLARKGIPFTVTDVKAFRGDPATQSQVVVPAANIPQGTGIVGAHGYTTLDDVTVVGFPNGIDLSPSEKADVKKARVYALAPIPPQPAPTTAQQPLQTPTPQQPNVGCIGGTGNACAGENHGTMIGTLGYLPPPNRVIAPDEWARAKTRLETVTGGAKVRIAVIGTTAEIKSFSDQIIGLFQTPSWEIIYISIISLPPQWKPTAL